MKILSWLLLAVTLALPAFGRPSTNQTVTLAWDPNPEVDIAGYRLYHGTETRFGNTNEVYLEPVIEITNATQCVVTNLEYGFTYFFAVTAFNTSGLESDFSNEVSYTTPNKPSTTTLRNPVRLSIILQRSDDPQGPYSDLDVFYYGIFPDGQHDFYRSSLSVVMNGEKVQTFSVSSIPPPMETQETSAKIMQFLDQQRVGEKIIFPPLPFRR